MKFDFLPFVIGLVVGALIVGIILGLRVSNQNKIIDKQGKEIASLQEQFQKREENLKAELSKAGEEIKKQFESLAQPDLPVRVALRNAYLTNTKVLQITNFSNTAIRVNVSSDFEGKTQARTIDLPPNITVELGQKEGFPFRSGDSVKIESQGYRTKSVSLR